MSVPAPYFGDSDFYRRLLESLPGATWRLLLPDFRFDYVGGNVEQVLGHSADELLARPERLFASASDPALQAMRADFIDGRCAQRYRYRVLGPDGIPHCVEQYTRAERDRGGRLLAVSAVCQTLSRRELELGEQSLAARAFDAWLDAGVIVDDQEIVVRVNPAFETITGFETSDVLGKPAGIFRAEFRERRYHEETWRSVQEVGSWQGEMWNHRRDGSRYREWLSIGTLRGVDGAPTHYVLSFQDLGLRRRVARSREFVHRNDELTGLAGRGMFKENLRQALMEAKSEGRSVALFLMDMDRFKPINDSLGHESGDRLLRIIADRLKAVSPRPNWVARIGDDEFALMLADLPRDLAVAREVNEMARTILEVTRQPATLDGHNLTVTMSVGIALFPHDAYNAEAMLTNADAAMYHAKVQGKNNYQFYAEDMNAEAMGRLILEGSLRGALERGEFELHYQPQIDARSGRLVGVEALLRWEHGEHGPVSPSVFIPMAEETGVILPLGHWVLNQACRQARAWEDAGFPLRVGVNLSALQFRQQDLPHIVREALARFNLDPASLELELTEGTLIEDVGRTLDMLRTLSEMGVGLSVDDFGTGYSSLSYLRRFPIKTLKIDRSFVRELTEKVEDASIVSAVISLAHNLNLNVIAEGVETEEQFTFLAEHRCDQVQGYYFSRPVAAAKLTEMLLSRRFEL
ncbi:MAG: EAL domain-containing protein [Chromatiales bacterium]|nr:EAL domain-containing protein [Chromatiales bacterium]